jgi:DNA-binding PadR family transcriptional regulator
MSRRKVSNPLALAVLACLYERPMHPYEIASTLRERHKDESIKLNYGSLYSVVESLKGHNLITEQQTGRQGNRPERTVYEVTDAGRLELIDWMSELLCRPAKEFTRFEAGLSLLPVLPPNDVRSLLEERCRRLEVEIEQYRNLRKLVSSERVPRLFWIESEYRVALREAELNFTRGLIADLANGSLEGMERWLEVHRSREPDSRSG